MQLAGKTEAQPLADYKHYIKNVQKRSVNFSNTLLKPKRHSLRCHDFMVHAFNTALLLRMRTNDIDYEIDYAWTSIHGIHDNGHVITACDVWL